MTTKPDDFIWYAPHPEIGELIFVSRPGSNRALIYSVRMVRERLGPALNDLQKIELGLGPMGSISRDIYMECGMTVWVPFKLRLVTLFENYRLKDQSVEEITLGNDHRLQEFILDTWNLRFRCPAV